MVLVSRAKQYLLGEAAEVADLADDADAQSASLDAHATSRRPTTLNSKRDADASNDAYVPCLLFR